MFAFLKEESFVTNYQSKKHYVFRNIDLETPSWNDILMHLNRNIVSKSKIKVLDNLGFVYFDADCMEPVNK
jgi:hypothetical protein